MITIDLTAGCSFEKASCHILYTRELELLDVPNYSFGVSVMTVPDDWAEHHRTARKRVYRAQRLGYYVAPIEPSDYHSDYLWINRSLPERQGKPMPPAYTELQKQKMKIGPKACAYHHKRVYGVFTPGPPNNRLCAYIGTIRCGQLLHISQLLGHGDLLDDGIMYLGIASILSEQPADTVMFYNRHDSGTEGLQFFKERLGLSAQDVKWR